MSKDRTARPARSKPKQRSRRGTPQAGSPARRIGTWLVPMLAAVGVLAALWAMAVLFAPGRDDGLPAPPASSGDGSTPAPWEYDAENDRHWDPAHGHWHDGPPPPEVSPEAPGTPVEPVEPPDSAQTPRAWEYDAENDRHWDPAHGHWHDGPPPTGVDTPDPRDSGGQ